MAKALCLAEEFFTSDAKAEVWVQRRRNCQDKRYQMSPKYVKEYDQCFLLISGEVIVKIYRPEAKEEDLEVYSASLKKGDLLFLPRGTPYQLKSKKSK